MLFVSKKNSCQMTTVMKVSAYYQGACCSAMTVSTEIVIPSVICGTASITSNMRYTSQTQQIYYGVQGQVNDYNN